MKDQTSQPSHLEPSGQTALERAVAELIVCALQLDLQPSDIRPEACLLGDGLGLDWTDALDLALAICRTYRFELHFDDKPHHQLFASLRSLSAYIEAHGTPWGASQTAACCAETAARFACVSASVH